MLRLGKIVPKPSVILGGRCLLILVGASLMVSKDRVFYTPLENSDRVLIVSHVTVKKEIELTTVFKHVHQTDPIRKMGDLRWL